MERRTMVLVKSARMSPLLLAAVCLLSGCFVQEDSITISSDGRVSFESLVTVADQEEKIQFSDLDKITSDVAKELQGAHWTVERSWVSKKRPYQFKMTGSGQLAEVARGTRFYSLESVGDKIYRIKFLTPGASANGSRRILFTSSGGKMVRDKNGGVVSQIDDPSEEVPYTIVLS
jgi:hypothetical protein